MADGCNPFHFTFSGPAQDLVNAAEQKVQQAGGTFDGDAGGGTFDVPVPLVGKVEGGYQIGGQQLTVKINRKPFLLPCSSIESYVKSMLPS